MMSLLQALVLFASAASAPPSFDFSIAASRATYAVGQPIVLRCKFTNVTPSKQTVLLPGRNSGAPGFLSARVWSDHGALLTKNDVDPDGWWSVRALDSHLYQEAEGDRVEVGPGRELVVDVDLAIILRGCRSLDARPLRAGRYRVQLKSQVGSSNELTIDLTSGSGRGPRRR
jgi:hypothetical protein